MKKITIISFIFLLVGINILAFSASDYQGGTWNHGSNAASVWSDYHHPSEDHWAAIYNQGTGNTTCVDEPADVWANASEVQFPGDQIAQAGHESC